MEDIKAPIFYASFIVRRDICDLHGIFKIPIQTFRTKRHQKVSFPMDTFLDFRDIKEDSNSVDVITKARMETLSLTAIKICNILISLLTISSPNKYSSCHS